MGKFKIPTTPFKLAVSGLDNNDKFYQRVLPRIFTASTQSVPESSSTLGLLIFGGVSIAHLKLRLKRN
ncbi:hypothetical protein [Anabaena sp. CCY 9910]|uniref:hypothetical protein n=1 Tax=Anabaena sp. CCY 9910 TaxID=3103870 RepID=UPI0039E15538